MVHLKHLIVAVVLTALIAWIVLGCHDSLHGGLVSDHSDGRRFFNEEPDHTSFGDRVKWLWNMNRVKWPGWIDDPPHPKTVKSVDHGNIKVTFINHATVLIQMDGLNILTD